MTNRPRVLTIAFALIWLAGCRAMMDPPTCSSDESIVPRHPIDVTARQPVADRVVLVPIDDFPVDRAAAVAEFFRKRFGVRIDVYPAMSWPPGAFVERRQQMNSAVMLKRLESAFVGNREGIVAIGLTTRDMFNPEVNWNYVFSYRGNSVAVVSLAHMDWGCEANEDVILARLRKMVGKNIGLQYFGLEMSEDPASMLYGRVGGPQELDAMSERY